MALFSDFEFDIRDLPSPVRRMQDIRLTVPSDRVNYWLDMFHRAQPVRVTLPQWCGNVFVKEVIVRNPVGGLPPDADVTLAPTGKPELTIGVSGIQQMRDSLEEFNSSIARSLADKMARQLDAMFIKGANVVENKKLDRAALKANRYYVGSRDALALKERFGRNPGGATRATWGHAKVEDAIAHAEELLESQDGQEQFIVKIIKVVRRKPTPVVVEDLK